MSHTPRPWGTLEIEDKLFVVKDGAAGVRVIAEVRTDLPAGEARSNAHVMAAAPDMLHELETAPESTAPVPEYRAWRERARAVAERAKVAA